MIKLATVFSGIGAIEHALERMQIDHEIVFACDNGDVDILTKEIAMNIDEIGTELESLKEKVGKIHCDDVQDIYKEQLIGMLNEADAEYDEIVAGVKKISSPSDEIKTVLEAILRMKGLKKARLREYSQFLNGLFSGSKEQQTFKGVQVILEVANDFKKDNPLEKLGDDEAFVSTDGIEWRIISEDMRKLYDYLESNDGKKIIRKVQDLSQRVSQLHEKINYIAVQRRLEEFGDNWKARKEYVDSLYAGLEKRNKVKQSYMANYILSDDDYHWNVAFLDGKQYAGKVDLFVGGSPCQSFSFVGKQRGLDDTRGTLFYEYARLIDEIKPKVFIYENVRAVTTHDGGRTWEKMKQVFRELGYDFFWDVLNAKNYGIPQNRERLFVVGLRHDLKKKTPFVFPESVPLDKGMKDFLIDHAPTGHFLPKKGVGSDFVPQSEGEEAASDIPELEKYFLSEKVKKYVLSTGTKNFYSKPETDLDIARPLLTTMHKMHRAGVDNYVTTQGRLRKLTPRECLRLMGFSDSFQIVVADTSMYQQAGNSIVVDVLMAIMTEILKTVDFEEVNE